jgi:DNA-binding MurR/RpiR family transcriptional regulator
VKTAVSSSSHLSVQKALHRKILDTFQDLPANQQKVANYILNQPNELAFLTTDLLARKLSVSKPTIVRFARSLGYEGFADLQKECLGALQADLSNVNKYMGELKRQTQNEALTRVVEAELRNIDETLNHFDRTVFNDVVSLLLRAKHVYTMGIGVSSLLSQFFAYELNQVAVHARSISSGPTRFVELLGLAHKGDVVVAFSFPPYSRETVEAAKFARERGAEVIAITDIRSSPITFHASQVIVGRTKNMLYTNSVAAITILINAIVTEIALKNKKAITPTIEAISRAMRDTDQYLP